MGMAVVSLLGWLILLITNKKNVGVALPKGQSSLLIVGSITWLIAVLLFNLVTIFRTQLNITPTTLNDLSNGVRIMAVFIMAIDLIGYFAERRTPWTWHL